MSKKAFWAAAMAVWLSLSAVGLAAAEAGKVIVINIPAKVLKLYSGGELLKTYPVGIGRADQPTPLGNYAITVKEINPVWINPAPNLPEPQIIPSGVDNPLGYRWLEFAPLYGIHGTNVPESIGGFVSNGCVRMYEQDVEELYDMVDLGTPVKIMYERLEVVEDNNGLVWLAVLPDEYGRQPVVGQAELAAKLKSTGIKKFICPQELQERFERTKTDKLLLGSRQELGL